MSNNSKIMFKKDWLIPSREGKIEDHYNINVTKDVIGSGSFANVVKATTKDGNIARAVKIIKKERISDKDKFRDEIEILKTLDHPNIIKLIETFEDGNNVYIITELCTGGEMFDRIIDKGNFTESEARKVFREILQAINYCHSHGICHKDLKPENFLFLDKSPTSHIKLIDFGFAERFSDERHMHPHRMSAKVGTAYYISPEVIAGNYDESCDVWSAGVILYILLCGYPPFNGSTDYSILEKVKRCKYDFSGPEWKTVSNSAKNFISSMLTSPSQRLTAEQALQHTWMKEEGGDNEQPLNINYTLLKNFVSAERFKKVALTAIASRLSESEISDLSAAFKKLDANGDGVLTFEELRNGVKELNHKSGGEIRAIMDAIDTDDSNTIDYTEFIAATMSKNLYLRNDKLMDAFMVFDKDRNGKITADELKETLERDPKCRHNIQYYRDLIREVDRNGDGMIDYQEFIQMMQKTQ